MNISMLWVKLEYMIYNLEPRWYYDAVLSRKPLVMINRDLDMDKRRTLFLQQLQHTAGIYGFFVCLVQAARKEAGYEFCWWETGAMCVRGYRVGEQWYNLRPDAALELSCGAAAVAVLVEVESRYNACARS